MANEYREKTAAEKVNEAQAWREYYESDKTTELKSSQEHDDKASEKVDISRTSISKGRKVKEMLWLEKTKRQMDAAGSGPKAIGDEIDKSVNFNWREEVAKEIGVSEGSVQKATDVYRFAYSEIEC